VAGLVVLMRLVDVFWLIAPVFSRSEVRLHWMDILAPIGIGGLWLGVFLGQLRKRPLLPVGDPRFQEALEHGTH
jgi:hypothetical protein